MAERTRGRAWAVVLAALAGACTTSVAPSGPYACGEGGGCPAGFSCVNARCVGDAVGGGAADARVVDAGPVPCAGSIGPEFQCFESIAQTLNHAQAQRECEIRGGYLATITSEAEHEAFLDALVNGSGWIGLTFSGGTPAWGTGEAVTFDWWLAGEPDGSGCVQATFLGWRDTACNDRGSFVCERPAR